MFFAPLLVFFDHNFVNLLRKSVFIGHTYPLPSIRISDPISVLPFVFLELNVVQNNKMIGRSHLVKIPYPGHKLRLVNCNGHKKVDSDSFPPLLLVEPDVGGLHGQLVILRFSVCTINTDQVNQLLSPQHLWLGLEHEFSFSSNNGAI